MEMGKMVRNLPNVAEKIRFVNPYERPWSAAEKKHHRWISFCSFHFFLFYCRHCFNIKRRKILVLHKIPLYYKEKYVLCFIHQGF